MSPDHLNHGNADFKRGLQARQNPRPVRQSGVLVYFTLNTKKLITFSKATGEYSI
jgi:hypothetical protein